MDVDDVMRRYAEGDSAAFDELYATLGPRLYSFCVRLSGRSEADDLFQESFLKLHRSRGSYVPGSSVLHWAFAIARSTYIDRHRWRARRPEELARTTDEHDETSALDGVAGEEASPESTANARALERIVATELQRMSERNRSAYLLMRVEGLTASEAAAILGISSDAVKQRAHRAYETIRATLLRAGWTEAIHA